MQSRSWARHLLAAVILSAVAALAAYAVYRETLHYGFDYDDYYFIRPHSIEQVLASFHGPWDTTGVMVKFYRPLTVAFSAARFEIFGLNAVAHHALSLTLFALAAFLSGWLVYRCTSRVSAALLASLLFVCHPAMPYSLVAWITNQMHLLQILAVLTAFLWWDRVRSRSLWWWLPLLLFAAASFLIKEDGITLLPAIACVHEIRRRTVDRTLRPVPLMFVALAMLTVIGLVGLRAQMLGELGGYGRPTLESAWRNIWRTLYGLYTLTPADREWQATASWFSVTLPAAAALAWKWISPAARFCLAAGAAVAVAFSPLLAFATKAEQVYLIAWGLSIVLTGGALALLDGAAARSAPRVATVGASAVLAAGIISLAAVSRAIARDFEPFGPGVLYHDSIVLGWPFLPPELHQYLVEKRKPGAAERLASNPADVLPVVSYNGHGRERSPDGTPYMWMAGTTAEIFVTRHARVVTIPLRHAIEVFRDASRVDVEIYGKLADRIQLTTPEWRYSSIALRGNGASRLTGMHRLRLTIDRAWRPSELIPGSQDHRILGVQIGEITIR